MSAAKPLAGDGGVYEQRLRQILDAVRAYLPPDGIAAKEAMSRIVACVDPWPEVAQISALPELAPTARDAARLPNGYVLVSVQRLKNARALVDRGAWDEGAKILDELIALPATPAGTGETA